MSSVKATTQGGRRPRPRSASPTRQSRRRWQVSRVRHSPSEIRYVSENEVPAPKATRNATYVLAGASVSGAIPRPWLPNRRKIVHEPVRYPITATLQARPAPGHDDDKPIWRPTNPNSRRPYNVRELESNFKFELEAPSSRQRLRRAAKRSRSRPVLNGPWIPSDVRYSKGVGWGTINPFPPYDPYEVADSSSA